MLLRQESTVKHSGLKHSYCKQENLIWKQQVITLLVSPTKFCKDYIVHKVNGCFSCPNSMIHEDFKIKLLNLFPPIQAEIVFSEESVSVKCRLQTLSVYHVISIIEC